MYCFLDPTVELDDRILKKIWRYSLRLPRFYDKFQFDDADLDDDEEPGPSGIGNGEDGLPLVAAPGADVDVRIMKISFFV